MTPEEKLQQQFEYVSAQSIATLTKKSYEQWGDPVKNRETLVPYGYAEIDRAIWGIAPQEFVLIQGPEKGRKSTFVHNVIKHINQRKQLVRKPVIVMDILESSSGPAQVKDTLLCMVASEYIMSKGHRSNGFCTVCGDDVCHELQLSSRGIQYMQQSNLQRNALAYAISEVANWTVYLFGPGMSEGNTRNLDDSLRRWAWMIENLGATMFITDHIQQYYSGRTMTDYEKQQWVIPALSTFVGQYKTSLLALSQLSLGTRIANKDGGRMYATGGAQGAAEANTVIQTAYDEDHPTEVGISIVESRYSGKLTIYSPIDPTSGLTYGKTSFESIHTERPQSEAEKKNKDLPYGN